jgi:hypothetical protein
MKRSKKAMKPKRYQSKVVCATCKATIFGYGDTKEASRVDSTRKLDEHYDRKHQLLPGLMKPIFTDEELATMIRAPKPAPGAGIQMPLPGFGHALDTGIEVHSGPEIRTIYLPDEGDDGFVEEHTGDHEPDWEEIDTEGSVVIAKCNVCGVLKRFDTMKGAAEASEKYHPAVKVFDNDFEDAPDGD